MPPSLLRAPQADQPGSVQRIRFWEAHDALLAMAPHVEPPALEKLGADLGLDRTELGKALATGRYRGVIDGDVQKLARLGGGGRRPFS